MRRNWRKGLSLTGAGASGISPHVESEGTEGKVKRQVPRLLLTVGDAAKWDGKVFVHYLTRGLSWAPSYRVDITDPKTLALEQQAVVKNELADLGQSPWLGRRRGLDALDRDTDHMHVGMHVDAGRVGIEDGHDRRWLARRSQPLWL